MSSLITSNISDGTTSVPTGYVVNGSAKAWVRFNQSTMSIGGSENISSLTDDGTGMSDVNLTNAFSSASVIGASGITSPDVDWNDTVCLSASTTASQLVLRVGQDTTLQDNALVSVSAFGDLA